MSDFYDFAIIGGSISGALAAKKLANAGHNVLLVEKEEKFSRRVCGEYLCPAGLDVLHKENLDHIIDDHALPIVGMKIFSPSGRVVDCDFPSRLDHTTNGVSVNRKALDNSMITLAGEAGAHILRGSPLKQLQTTSRGWILKLENGKELEAAFIIGADGRRSTVARLLGLKKESESERIALHCHIQTKNKTERKGEMHLFKDGSYIGINPTGNKEINISIVCDAKQINRYGGVKETFNHYINSSSHILEKYGEIVDENSIRSASPITNKMDTIVGVNYAFIGDASGFLDPLTGEGMYVALWTAKHLAEKIIMNFNHEHSVQAYSKLKKIYFRSKVRLNKFFQIIIRMPWVIELIASYLSKKKERSDIFIGIVGNIYTPLQGILKIIKS